MRKELRMKKTLLRLLLNLLLYLVVALHCPVFFFFINIHIKHGFLHHGSRNPHQIRICYVRVLF